MVNAKEQQMESWNESGYGGSDTGSWLLSLMQSLLLSLFLWQPMMMMIWALLSGWMFTWNLPISVPKQLPALCRRCCCGPTSEDLLIRERSQEPGSVHQPGSVIPTPRASVAPTAELGALASTIRLTMFGQDPGEDLPNANQKVMNRSTTTKALVVANPDRPLDMISFLANDEWIVDDTMITPTGPYAMDIEDDTFTESVK